MVQVLGKVVRDNEITGRDLSFKSVLRELKGKGWARKPPPRRSLDDRYFYVRPGESSSGTEGVHFFRGEDAVLEYYANALRNGSRAPAAIAPPPTPPRAAPGDAQLAAAAKVVRLNYLADIERAEARAQSATNAASRVPTAAQGAATQAATQSDVPQAETQAREREVVTTPTTPPLARTRPVKGKRPARRSLVRGDSPMASTPPRSRCPTPLLATSPHVQDSDASMFDDAPSDDTTPSDHEHSKLSLILSLMLHCMLNVMMNTVLNIMVNVMLHSAFYCCFTVDDHGDDEEAEAGALGNELLADSTGASNVVTDGDSVPQFGSMDSGDEAEKDDIENGEYGSDEDVDASCAPDDVVDDPEQTEKEIAAEVLFAENFLSQFGGEDEVLADNLKNAVLRGMSATGWEDVVQPDTYDYLMTPYEPVNDAGSYPGLRQGYSGPSAEVLRRGDSPITQFFYFMPVVLWQHIA
ncbi:hypothetical protein PHYSODRAFT_398887, partial [Phytophthora sojae]